MYQSQSAKDKPALQKETSFKNLKILHQNIQRLAPRIESLEITLNEIEPDLLILCEHKMTTPEIENTTISGYSLKSHFSRSIYLGGGVAIFSKHSFKIKNKSISSIDELITEKEFECCLIECQTNNSFRFVLAGLYRSPCSDVKRFLHKFDILLEILLKNYEHVIIGGDININVLDKFSKHTKLFMDTINGHGVRYLVNFPTRVTEESESAIDNFLINFDPRKTNTIGINTLLSDHDAQLLEIVIPKPNITNQLKLSKLARNFSLNNLNSFSDLLSNESWIDVYNSSVECKFDVFYNIFLYYFSICFPVTRIRIRNKSKLEWLSEELKSKKENILLLNKIGRSTKNKQMLRKTKILNNMFKCEVLQEKRKYFTNTIKNSKNTSKTTWKLLNNEMGKNNRSDEGIYNLLVNGSAIAEPQKICESFNNYYIDVVDTEVIPEILKHNPQLPKLSCSHSENNRKFHCVPISEKELTKIISSFENKFSTGYDGVPIVVIKHAMKHLTRPLVHIINSSFISGIFPDKLKTARVKPLFKKGEKSNIKNYRPVSLLPVFSKLYEKAMHIRLVHYLESNNLFDKEQHGFRSGHSVITAATEYINSIINAIDAGDRVTGVFMDLTKAFDSVSHSKLIEKLQILGIKGPPLSWLRSYLFNRTQFVEINYQIKNQCVPHKSKLKIIKHGVPQGSILGPLLFLCYILGLPNVIADNYTSSLCLYADDANLKISGKTKKEVEQATTENLSNIIRFFSQNQILLNFTKTNFMEFSSKFRNNVDSIKIRMNNTELKQVHTTKFLGLYIDNNLSWDSHVSHVAKRVALGNFVLYRLSRFCCSETLRIVYFAHVHSIISFGISIYGATSKNNMNRILILQKRAIRIILNLGWHESVKEYFKDLNIMTVYSCYVYETILFTKFQSKAISLMGDNHSYDTRFRQNFAIPKHRLKFFEKMTTYMGGKFINKLPHLIKQENDPNKFKKVLKKFIISRPLYSLDEYFI